VGRRRAHPLRWLVAILAVLSAIFPLAWVIRVAVKPPDNFIGDPSGLGGGFTLQNFSDAINSGGLRAGILNSIEIVPLGSLGATALATIGGFALAKLDVPLRRLWLAVIAAAIAVPLPAIIISLFDQGLSFGYTDSRPGLSLVYAGIFSSWGTYFMYSYYTNLPQALLDSARVDGASDLQTLLRVAVPLAKPAIATVLVINVFIQWSDLILALVMLPESSMQTATVKVALYSTQFRSGGPAQAAALLIASIPVFAIYFAGQRFIRAGTFAGGVKE
jgi:ABC-type glycerol-3-phosphate transport system permease component